RTFYVTEAMLTPEPHKGSGGLLGWLRTLAPFGAVVAALLVVFVLTRPTIDSSDTTTASAPQASEPEIAVLATDEMETAEEASPTESGARQSDGAPVPDGESRLVPESPAADAEMVPDAQGEGTPTEGFSITAPIVGGTGVE